MGIHIVDIEGELPKSVKDRWVNIIIKEVDWTDDRFVHAISPGSWLGDYNKDALKYSYQMWQAASPESRMPWQDKILNSISNKLKVFCKERELEGDELAKSIKE